MAPDDAAQSSGGLPAIHKAVAGVFVTGVAPVLVAFGVKFSAALLTAKPAEKKAEAASTTPAQPAGGATAAAPVPAGAAPGPTPSKSSSGTLALGAKAQTVSSSLKTEVAKAETGK